MRIEDRSAKYSYKKIIISNSGLFYFAFIIRFIGHYTLSSNLGELLGNWNGVILDILNYLVVLMLLFKIIWGQKYTSKEVLIISIISVCSIFSALVSKRLDILLTWLFVVAGKDINIEKVAKLVINMTIAILPIMSVLALSGIIENVVYIRENSRLRFSLGYSNPNTVGAIVLQFCVAWIVWRNGKYRILDFIFLLFTSSLFNIWTDCRSAMLLCIVICICNLKDICKKGVLAFFFRILIVLIPIFSYISAVYFNFNNRLMVLYNDLTSWRLYYANLYYKRFGFSIWGRNIEMLNTYLDNAYIHMGIIYGWVILLLYLIALWKLIPILEKHPNGIAYLSGCSIYLLYGLLEARFFIITNNFLSLLICSWLYSDKNMEQVKKC